MAEMSDSSSECSEYVIEITGEKLRKAEQAKEATMEILQDALEKKMYGHPISFYQTCGKPVDSYKFCCIPTEQFLRDLLKKMETVNFKEDKNPDYDEGIFAYVYTNKSDRERYADVNLKDDFLREKSTVYLCNQFWEAPDHLCVDCKPGTLIHEVSHFLWTEDITYDHVVVELYEDYRTLLGNRVVVKDEEGLIQDAEDVILINANSLEHEFETMINHEEDYHNGKYMCCKETKRNSVCRARSIGHYHLHENFERHKAAAEARLAAVRASLQLENPEETLQAEKIKYIKRKNQACQKEIIQRT